MAVFYGHVLLELCLLLLLDIRLLLYRGEEWDLLCAIVIPLHVEICNRLMDMVLVV